MLSAEEIRNITFSKAMNGYKKEEVEILLEKVESDYEQFRRQIRLLQEKTVELQKQVADISSSKDSIQTVLVSAQKLADQIIADAKAQAEGIISKADNDLEATKQGRQNQIDELDKLFKQRKLDGEAEIENMMREAGKKRDAMLRAAADSVERQQALFDKTHLETMAFKNDMISKCRDFAAMISKLPDEVPLDAKRAAAAVEELFLKQPDVAQFVEQPETDAPEADAETPAAEAELSAENTAEPAAQGNE